MMNSASYLAGGTLVSLFAAMFSPIIDGHFSPARSETFDARWAVLASTAKQDRLAAPRTAGAVQIVATTDSRQGVTTLAKVDLQSRKPTQESPKLSPVREVPHDSAQKEKLPVGCEPSFSPVTTPAMAHVTGRCLASRETGRQVAELAR